MCSLSFEFCFTVNFKSIGFVWHTLFNGVVTPVLLDECTVPLELSPLLLSFLLSVLLSSSSPYMSSSTSQPFSVVRLLCLTSFATCCACVSPPTLTDTSASVSKNTLFSTFLYCSSSISASVEQTDPLVALHNVGLLAYKSRLDFVLCPSNAERLAFDWKLSYPCAQAGLLPSVIASFSVLERMCEDRLWILRSIAWSSLVAAELSNENSLQLLLFSLEYCPKLLVCNLPMSLSYDLCMFVVLVSIS